MIHKRNRPYMKRETGDVEYRPTRPDGAPAISMEQRLMDEVQRLEERLEAARDDLRRWRMSHDGDPPRG